MNNYYKYLQNKNMKKDFIKYIIPIILLSLIGITVIYLSKETIKDSYSYFYRQIIFLIISIILLFVCQKISFSKINKFSLTLYILCILSLIYVLIFGTKINGSKSWINLFGISIQPSEFTKITLLLCINKYIKTKYGLLKSILLLIIPSILTFLQPDTGTVLFYIVIFFSIFVSLNLNKKYYITLFSTIILFIGMYFYLYFYKSELFIKILGTSFFYRTDRILNFMNNEGYQIKNALIGIGNGKLLGNGFKYVIYIPEAITDFMFANILMKLGFIGGLVVILNFLYLDFLLINDIKKINKNKYYIIGLFGLFIYQQVQHIFMNLELLPITGITLPFISYGGSSLLSYYILFGILLNIKKYHYDT